MRAIVALPLTMALDTVPLEEPCKVRNRAPVAVLVTPPLSVSVPLVESIAYVPPPVVKLIGPAMVLLPLILRMPSPLVRPE